MAEFCLDCWNELNDSQDPKSRYVMSKELELCEGCGQYKSVIIVERFWSRTRKLFQEITENMKNQ